MNTPKFTYKDRLGLVCTVMFDGALPCLDGSPVRSKETIKNIILDILSYIDYNPMVFVRPLPASLINWRDVDRNCLCRLLRNIIVQLSSFFETHHTLEAVHTVAQSYFLGNDGFCFDIKRALDSRVVRCDFKSNERSYCSYIPIANVSQVVSNFLDRSMSLTNKHIIIT